MFPFTKCSNPDFVWIPLYRYSLYLVMNVGSLPLNTCSLAASISLFISSGAPNDVLFVAESAGGNAFGALADTAAAEPSVSSFGLSGAARSSRGLSGAAGVDRV